MIDGKSVFQRKLQQAAIATIGHIDANIGLITSGVYQAGFNRKGTNAR